MSTDVDLRELAIDRRDATGSTLQPRRHLLTRYVLPGLLIAGFLALVVWASWELFFPPRPVTVVPVLATQSERSREGTTLFKAAGWIEPRPTAVRAAALAPGVVKELLVVEDQAVAEGEPVAKLVEDDARLSHELAEAQLQLRQAELQQAQATLAAAITRFEQPVHLQAELSAADAMLAKVNTQLENLPFEIDRADAELEFAQKNYEGKRGAADSVSGRSIEEAKSRQDAAQARLDGLHQRGDSLADEQTALIGRRDALKKQLELLTDELQAKDEAAAKLKAAEARVRQAETALAEAKLRLDRMTVRAPVAGRVYQLVGQPGTTLAGSFAMSENVDSSTVVTLYRPQMLQVRVDVRFEDIPKVSLGQPVEIDNPALATPLTGTVLFVSSLADIQKNTLEVKVAMDEPPTVFKPDMLVDVSFLAPKQEQDGPASGDSMRLYVPQQLIQQGDDGKFVWLADQTAKVARKQFVQTGNLSNAGLIEVTSGLTPAARIIASETDGLRDGDRIRVTGEQATLSGNADAKRDRGRMERLPKGGH